MVEGGLLPQEWSGPPPRYRRSTTPQQTDNQDMKNEFRKYARSQGVSTTTLERYADFTSAYISPTVLEERQLNMTQMDVFSRLMMDRILFLGAPIDDTVANIIQGHAMKMDGRRRRAEELAE